jgi:type VI secretion system secreted protein Hcp
VPGSSGVIDACVQVTTNASQVTVPVAADGNVRIIDPSQNQSCSTGAVGPAGGSVETALDWNQTGPTGAPGVAGVAGPKGASGPAGAADTITIIGSGLAPRGASIGEMQMNSTITGQRYHFPIVSYGLTQSPTGGTTGGSATSGQRRHQPFTIVKETDAASPRLLQAVAAGTHYKSAIIICRKAGGSYLEVTLTNVTVSGLSQAGGGDRPVESVSFEYGAISFKYTKAIPDDWEGF